MLNLFVTGAEQIFLATGATNFRKAEVKDALGFLQYTEDRKA